MFYNCEAVRWLAPPVNRFPFFYSIRRFIIVSIRVCYWSWSCARWIQSECSHHTTSRFLVILSSHLRLVLGITTKFIEIGFENVNWIKMIQNLVWSLNLLVLSQESYLRSRECLCQPTRPCGLMHIPTKHWDCGFESSFFCAMKRKEQVRQISNRTNLAV
jgi:hypothetical protein